MRSIQLVVNPDGSVTVKFQGFRGEACFREAEELYRRVKVAGVEVKVERAERTEEAYVAERAVARARMREVESGGAY